MKGKQKNKLGDRELDIMQVLWQLGGATIGEVHKALLEKDEEIAYTTVQTMLNRLEAKGTVKRDMEGAAYHYRSLVRKSEVIGTFIGRLTDRFFKDSTEELIIHLVKQELEDEQLERIQTLIDKQRRKGAKP